VSAIENLGRMGLAWIRKVVHDEQHTYGEGYKKIYDTHRNIRGYFLRLTHVDIPHMSLDNIPEFEMAPSHQRQMLQAADLLAGAVKYLCMKSMSGGPLSPAETELAELTIPAMLCPKPPLAVAVCSNLCLRAVGTTCLPSLGVRADLARTETRPHGEPDTAELLPRLQAEPRSIAPTFKIDLPLYAIARRQDGQLLILNDDDANEPEEDEMCFPTVLPLFTERKSAQDWLDSFESGTGQSRQRIAEFGPKNLGAFIEALRNATQWTRIAVVDPGADSQEHVDLDGLVDGLEKALDRVVRVFGSGLDRVVLQKHAVAGKQAVSMLTSDGRYAAMIPPDGRIYEGPTREAALAQLKRGEGIE